MSGVVGHFTAGLPIRNSQVALLAVTFTTRGAAEHYDGEIMDTLLLSVGGYAARHGQRAEAVGVASYSSRARGPACVHTVLFAVVRQEKERPVMPNVQYCHTATLCVPYI